MWPEQVLPWSSVFSSCHILRLIPSGWLPSSPVALRSVCPVYGLRNRICCKSLWAKGQWEKAFLTSSSLYPCKRHTGQGFSGEHAAVFCSSSSPFLGSRNNFLSAELNTACQMEEWIWGAHFLEELSRKGSSCWDVHLWQFEPLEP